MEEAQRLLTVSVWKLYRCRLQRGGLRLHRSLQLSLLVRAARHRYLSARAAAETGTPPAMATEDLTCAPAPNRADPSNRPIPDPSNRPIPDPSNRPTGDLSIRPIPDPSNRPTGDLSNRPIPDLSNRPIPDLSNRPIPDPSNRPTGDLSNRPTGDPSNRPIPDPSIRPTGDLLNLPIPDPSNRPSLDPSIRPTGNPSNQPRVPDPHHVPDRGHPLSPHREDLPSPPTPYRGAQDTRNASDRGNLPSPEPANRNHPQDSPSRYRDLPKAASATPPSEPLKPFGSLPVARTGRKRRSSGSAGDGAVPVPSKRARLEAEEPPLPPGPPGRCLGPLPATFGLLIRAVGAC